MRRLALIAASAFVPAAAASGDGVDFAVHGQAWTEAGRIMNASDTLIQGTLPTNALNLNGNGLQSLGAQFTVNAALGENWDGAFGFGTTRSTHALGSGKYSILAIPLWENFLTESRLTYFRGEKSAPSFSLTLGSFANKYNPDAKNLGLYLLRGPVYPGILMGGFGDFHADSTKGTMLGARLSHRMGNFSHDLILNSEREIPPTFDWSLAYVAKYKAANALELGAGINLYRLIPYNSDLTTPGHAKQVTQDPNLLLRYIEIDSSGAVPDTIYFTHQGTKLMGMFALDLKSLVGVESMGENDLKLYGETAILGITDYGKTYGDIMRRIPVMVGFNFPTFRLLDYLSLEVEWYGARFRNDLAGIGNNNVVAPWTRQSHPIPSPKPVTYADYGIQPNGVWYDDPSNPTDSLVFKGSGSDKENLTQDDWKWSLFAEKTLHRHIRFTAQIANDHYRPRPVATGLIDSNGGTAEAFSSPKDWYFMLRLGYFF